VGRLATVVHDIYAYRFATNLLRIVVTVSTRPI